MQLILRYLFFLFFAFSYSSITIIGIVKDDSDTALSSVNIIISNTKEGTITDGDGRFFLELNEIDECQLEVSHIGYKKYNKVIPCDRDQFLSIILSETNIDINEIVVIATKNESYIKDAPILTHVISSDDIAESSTYNINNILKQSMPNIQTVPSNHTGDRIKMQGLDNKYMLFLIDGDKISAEYAGNIDLSVINVSNIDKIEIVESSLSTLYGSNAIGGVVNIISKKNKDKFWISNIYSYDDILGFNKSISFGGSENNFFYDINYSLQEFRGYDLTPSTDDTGNPYDYTLKAYDKKFYKYSLGYLFSPNFNLSLSYNKFNSFIKDFDEKPDPVSNVDVQVYSNLLKKYNDDIYKLKINKLFSPESSMKLSLMYEGYSKINFYPYYYNNDQSDLNINSEEFLSADLEHSNIYFQYNKKKTDHNIVIGLEKNIDYYSSYNIYSQQDSLASASIFQGINQTKKYTETSFFIHDQFSYSDNSDIYYGLRYTDAMNFSDKCIMALSIINRHSSGYNVRLNFSSGYRIPSLKELYYEYPGHFIPLYGNPELKPTLSKSYSLSFDKRSEVNNFSIDFYLRNIKDFISTEYVDVGLIYRNYDYVLINGFNVNYRRKITDKSSIKFIYNYISMDSDSNEILELVSEHALYIKYKYSIADNFLLLAEMSYAGEKSNFSQENDIQELPAITILDPYWITDLVFSCNLNYNYDFKFGIKNIFDYKDSNRFEGTDLLNSYDPGRRFYFEIKTNFRKGDK